MYDQFKTSLNQKCQIDKTKPVLVGVSGGFDSICLLDLFNRSEYPIIVAHFNHGIRPEAKQDAQFVEQVAGSYGIPYVHGEESVPDYAQAYQISIEEAARITRYRFLFEQAEKFDCQAVAVAHNADDQVETVLMHLLRGAGLDGLKGMAAHMLPNSWSDTIPLIRPLLRVWRDDIEQYCKEHGLSAILDQTNLDTRLFRNRLRHELIPELETYIPGVRSRLWQMAELLQVDYQALEKIISQMWSEVMTRSGKGYIAFWLPTFQTKALGFKRRLVRKALKVLKPDSRDVDYAIIARVLDFIANPSQSGQVDIGMGLRALLTGDQLLLATWEVELVDDGWLQFKGETTFQIPGKLCLENGWILKVDLVDDPEDAEKEARQNTNPYHAWMELEQDQTHLFVRNRKPGDVFKPLGMGGNKMKLSDFMINLKIPQTARAHWPLVCVGDEIAWVPGYRLAHPFRLGRGGNEKVIKLQAYRS